MKSKGFTLVEMMVAVALFTVVMMVSIGSLLSLVDASRKAQAIQSVMNNLNITLDGAVRALRMGRNYRVGTDQNGDPVLSFTPYGASDLESERWAYTFVEEGPAGDRRGRIKKTYKPAGLGKVTVPITAAEVDIDEAKFYVTGTSTNDTMQPRVLIILRGKAGLEKLKTTTHFDIQASATQRILDL